MMEEDQDGLLDLGVLYHGQYILYICMIQKNWNY